MKLKGLLVLLGVALIASGVSAAEINFEALPPGTIVTVIDGVGVNGDNPKHPGINHAVVFDSTFMNPIRDADKFSDGDLGTPNELCDPPGPGNPRFPGESDAEAGPEGDFENCTPMGNVLIVGANVTDNTGDGLVDVPNDINETAIGGTKITFTFPADVVMQSIRIIDLDGNRSVCLASWPASCDGGVGMGPDPQAELYDEFDNLLFVAAFDNTDPGNGAKTYSLGDTGGVRKMVVWMQGSGAMDAITYSRRGGTGCTPGFWKNHDGHKKQADEWPAGYQGMLWETQFDCYAPLAGLTLKETIRLKGGGENKVGRHGTAALLNWADPSVSYPYGFEQIKTIVCSGKVGMLVMANELSDECPAKGSED